MQVPVPEQFSQYMPLVVQIATALAIFIVGWIASKWARALAMRVMRKSNVDEALARFLGAIVQYAVLAAAVITSLAKVGVETTSLVALLASAGLAVGLALQGTLGHFASGVMVLFFRPFDLGHRITAGGHTGAVNDIGLFATTLVTPDNEKIIIPNGEITGGSIVNFSERGKLRANISIGVAYGTDVDRAMAVMIRACQSCDKVLDDPAPSVAFDGFGASSLDFLVRPWSLPDDFPGMHHQVRLALNRELEAAGIEIPFDQMVLHKVD
ncbi:MAG: mechanosensitive ion channel domain-containing protein [Acidobacteriota bacterium]